MLLVYMVIFTINIPQMLAYIPDMDPMGLNMFAVTRRMMFCNDH